MPKKKSPKNSDQPELPFESAPAPESNVAALVAKPAEVKPDVKADEPAVVVAPPPRQKGAAARAMSSGLAAS